MTIAYCMSKRSSCLKRKVGVVVAHIGEFNELKDKDPREDSHIQFQVLSAGYNDVPLGLPACVFMNNRNCSRDQLKHNQTKKVKCCPNCGEPIPNKTTCPYCSNKNSVGTDACRKCAATLPSYEYTKCKKEVFGFLSAGENENRSKLLDMCRSLHAEENAIIGLTGVNNRSNRSK